VPQFRPVVVDLPRQIEPFAALTLERAHRIMLVLQQSVPSLHDATRMYEILTRTLAIPADRINIVVNRFHRNLSVGLDDIQQTLQLRSIRRSAYRTIFERPPRASIWACRSTSRPVAHR
jgi:pilus assembly protein CpaE